MTHQFNILHYDQVESTQDLAHEFARQGKDNLAVVASQQISGRGRGGNVWISPKGNLYTSIILRPKISVRDSGQYAFLAAVALYRAVKQFSNQPDIFTLKWPNDMLCRGKKCAGILLETQLTTDQKIDYMILGLGVNIVAAPDDKESLKSCCSEDVNADDILDGFLSHFHVLEDDLYQNGFANIRREWLNHAASMGQRIRARLPQETLYGIFEGLNDNGALVLRLDSGEPRMIHSGDIFLGWD